MSESKHTPGSCGCHLDPVKDDEAEPSDLCSEATGMNDGVGWKIVLCPLHAAAPELLEACEGMLHRFGHLDTDPGKREACSEVRAAIAKATET